MKKPDIRTIIDIQNLFRDYMSGVRVVMLIDRGVMNSNKGSKRWINKIITIDESSWIQAVNKLLEMQYYLNEPDIRLYSCLNNRKIDKAIQMFKHKQLDVTADMKERFYTRINDSFSSCLMKPENKNTKFFLLDIDSKCTKEVDKFISDNLIKIIHTYPTKKGWHYVAEPFDARLANGHKTFILNKDGLLLIHYLEN